MSYRNGPRIVNDGLVCYLDATNTKSYPRAGSTWYDLSKNANHGTLTNGPTFNTANGGSIVFDGVNDYVDCGNNSSLTMGATATWEFVAMPTATENYKPIFQKAVYSNSTGFVSLFFNPGALAFRVNASDVAESTRALDYQYSVGIEYNTWAHIAFVYNGTNFSIYKNGEFAEASSNWTYGLGTNTQNLLIGTFWAGSWIGKIPIFKQYNRALSAAEIINNYNATKRRFGL